MKKILILIVLVATCSTAINAESVSMLNNNQDNSWSYRDNNRNYRNHNNNYRANVPKDKLPASIINFLNKKYPGNEIMLSKQKSDGYYYVKIQYNQNARRPYYRNLVFDQKGNPVRG